jgi:Domain of unknown function (DUF4145)
VHPIVHELSELTVHAGWCTVVCTDLEEPSVTITYKLQSAQGNAIQTRSPNSSTPANAVQVPNIRCPHCMHMGAFTAVIPNDLQINHTEIKSSTPFSKGTSTVGIRSCPNPECRGLVFVVIDSTAKSIVLPNEVLDFDATDIPTPIAASLEKAIKCHSLQCYKAAALMVRRVLEELCEDRGATGSNLKERITALAKIVIIPQELIQAADHLRLLGNDAAHIEAKTYQAIGEPEVRISIDLTKELLKGAYQYKGLLGRLTALQKGP